MDSNHYASSIEHLRLLIDELSPDDWKERLRTLTRLGQAYDRTHQHKEALATFRSLMKLRVPKIWEPLFKLRAYEQMGLVALRQRRLSEARRFFAKAKEFLPLVAEKQAWRLRLENWTAAVLLRSGKTHEACRQFLKTLKEVDHLNAQGRPLVDNNELGEATLMSSEPTKAIPILLEELRHAKKARRAEKIAVTYYLLGEALGHEATRRFDDAASHYEAGLAIAEDHHLLELQVRFHNGLGNLFARRGKNPEAAEHYRTALHLAQQTESEAVSVELMVNLGFILSRIDRPSDAVDYLEAALDFSGGPKGEGSAFILKKRPDIFITLGDALCRNKELTRAEEYLLGALHYDRPGVLQPKMRYSLYGTLSEVYLATGKNDEVRKLLPELKALAETLPGARAHFEQIARQCASLDSIQSS